MRPREEWANWGVWKSIWQVYDRMAPLPQKKQPCPTLEHHKLKSKVMYKLGSNLPITPSFLQNCFCRDPILFVVSALLTRKHIPHHNRYNNCIWLIFFRKKSTCHCSDFFHPTSLKSFLGTHHLHLEGLQPIFGGPKTSIFHGFGGPKVGWKKAKTTLHIVSLPCLALSIVVKLFSAKVQWFWLLVYQESSVRKRLNHKHSPKYIATLRSLVPFYLVEFYHISQTGWANLGRIHITEIPKLVDTRKLCTYIAMNRSESLTHRIHVINVKRTANLPTFGSWCEQLPSKCKLQQ